MKYSVTLYKKPDNVPKHYSVISVVAFIAKNSYKKLWKYINGLVLLLKEVLPKLPNDFYLYLYHDNTIEETKHPDKEQNDTVQNKWIPLLNRLRQNPRVFLWRYDYPDFRDPDNKFYHITTFGTMVRFLPFSDKKIDIVGVMDIDLRDHSEAVDTVRDYNIFLKEKKCPFFFDNMICYHLHPWVRIQKIQKYTSFRIIASGLMSRIKIPIKLLNNFLQGLLDGTAILPKDIELMNQYIEVLDYKKGLGKVNKLFQYGFDEYYLNGYVLPYIIKKRITFMVLVNITNPNIILARMILKLKIKTKDFTQMSKLQKETLDTLIRNVLGSEYDKNKDLRHNIDVLFYKYDKKEETADKFMEELEILKDKKLNKLLEMGDYEYICLSMYKKIKKPELICVSYNRDGSLKYNRSDY
jgi:hypothetical protein